MSLLGHHSQNYFFSFLKHESRLTGTTLQCEQTQQTEEHPITEKMTDWRVQNNMLL